MSYMITRCPKCATAFRVTQDQLSVAKGSVRCGSCLTVFNALDQTSKVVASQVATSKIAAAGAAADKAADGGPAQGAKTSRPSVATILSAAAAMVDSSKHRQAVKSPASAHNTPRLGPKSPAKKDRANKHRRRSGTGTLATDSQITPQITPQTTSQIAPATTPAGMSAAMTATVAAAASRDNQHVNELITEHAIASSPGAASPQRIARQHSDLISTIQPAPLEMLCNQHKPKDRQWLWLSGIVLLILLMVFQMAVFQFQTLSKTEPYRSVYRILCPMLGCLLSDLVDTTKIRVSHLVLRSHPTVTDALIVDTILLNAAEFAQPYPDLLLKFNDINDQTIAFRQFYAEEYLAGELAGTKLMPIGQPVQLSIEIVDPGSEAVNYQIYVAQPRKRS